MEMHRMHYVNDNATCKLLCKLTEKRETMHNDAEEEKRRRRTVVRRWNRNKVE